MRTPARAIAWELWANSRAGIAAFGAALVLLAGAGNWLPEGSASEPIFPLSVILFALASMYLASKAMHCEYRDGALVSGYPSRMFTLPLRSRALVAWPMLYGAFSLALLWCAMALLVWLPIGIEPAWWLLPLLLVVLAWLQAVFWAVPGSTLAKILVACVVFPALKATLELVATIVALIVNPHSRLDRAAFIESRPLILTLFCGCFLPLAYAVAVGGVTLDRRGSRLEGAYLANVIERLLSHLPRPRLRFRSAWQAQFWIEFRSKGLILPLFPACFLAFVTIVVAPFVSTRQLLQLLLALCAAVPVVAFFVGYGLGKTRFWADDLRLSAWQATRPLSSETLAAAKLQTAALSALVTVGLLAVGVPLWLAGLGRFGDAFQLCQPYLQRYSAPAVCVIGLCGLWVMAWGQLVGGLVLSLTGRPWVINCGVSLYLLLLTAAGVAASWIGNHPIGLEKFWQMLSLFLGAVAVMKLLAIVWLICALRRRKLLNPARLAFGCGLWIMGASCIVALIIWQLPDAGLTLFGHVDETVRVPIHLVVLTSVLALPLVRPIAAPLAVAWNRHR